MKPIQYFQKKEPSMPRQTPRHRNGLRWGSAIVMWSFTILSLCAPGALTALPAVATPQENSAEVAASPVEEIAVSETAMEQVLVPEGYDLGAQASDDEVAEQQKKIQPLHDSSALEQSALEEATLARALISSPTAVVGVSFPHSQVAQDLVISYRTRAGEEWSEWNAMEMSEPSEEAVLEGTLVAGSDPVTVAGVEEIEVSVKDADGNSLPGAILNVLEPELEASDLERTQREVHGEAAVAASASVLTHVDEEVASAVDPVETEQSVTEPSILPEGKTDAEWAEENSMLNVPNNAGAQGLSLPATLRATGLSSDGRTFTTELPGLTITTRKGWGADESVMDWRPEYVTFKGAVVHHTAGTNNYTKAQVPGLIRGVYRYHAVTLGWGDVGYHLLVDKFGGVWEGRAGGLTKSVEGGHAYGANASTFGVSVLGNYQDETPSNEAIDAVSKVIAWKLKVHNITDLNRTFVVPGKQRGKSSVILPVVSGHRHVGGTACPGEAFMRRFDEVRSKVKSYTEELKKAKVSPLHNTDISNAKRATWAPTRIIGHGWKAGNTYAAGAFFGEGHTDGMIVDDEGRMWLYPGKDHGNFYAERRHIGNGWRILDQISAGIDFDGDSHPDVVGRLKGNGELRLYPGDGSGGFKPMRRIGYGWGVFSSIQVVPHMVDGKAVVYAVEKDTGRLRVYLTDGRGGFVSRVDLGGDWYGMRSFNHVGDRTGDGKPDFVAIDDSGHMWLYAGDNAAKFSERIKIGRGWENINPVVSSGEPGNFWGVNIDGTLLRYTFIGLR